ncbi:hypothetical protein K3495_g5615 [Podosphaera aphanis]|nr:hypothetical protein K3495_g5615 [Podosphaera aphanis]
MSKYGYTPLISDNAIYRNKSMGIIVASYVDDFLLIGPDKYKLQALTQTLNSEVGLNDLGDASWFLGVRIRRSSPTRCVFLDQQQYLERSFQEFGIMVDKRITAPLSPSCRADMRKNPGKATASELYEF